jgi:hypothetical protein
MFLFDWFDSKKNALTNAAESSGLGPADSTVPNNRLRPKLALSPANHAANRRTERLERRELLYSVVRDTMLRAGVLAASYKFKVLSLDARGRQYLIMMDLANGAGVSSSRLAEIEAALAQATKVQHDILVTAVYWRINEPVTVGLSLAPVNSAPQAAGPASVSGHRYQPLEGDEVAAFKRALASATPVAVPAASGKVVTSGRRNPAPPEEFEDTQVLDEQDPASPLSITLYGDLN